MRVLDHFLIFFLVFLEKRKTEKYPLKQNPLRKIPIKTNFFKKRKFRDY